MLIIKMMLMITVIIEHRGYITLKDEKEFYSCKCISIQSNTLIIMIVVRITIIIDINYIINE